MPSGIYCIENTIDRKKYIGQAKDFDKRLYHHKWNWNKLNYSETSGENRPLWFAIKKYGEESFTFSIIEECEKDKLNEYVTKNKMQRKLNFFERGTHATRHVS